MKHTLTILTIAFLLQACGAHDGNEYNATKSEINLEDLQPNFIRAKYEYIDSLILRLFDVKVWDDSDIEYDLVFINDEQQKFIFQFDSRSTCFNGFSELLKGGNWKKHLSNKLFKIWVDKGFGFPPGVEPILGQCYVTQDNGQGICWPIACLNIIDENNSNDIVMSNNFEHTYNEIRGVWKRNDESSGLNGMLVEIKCRKSEIYGEVIYVPDWRKNNLVLQAWKEGMIKWKNINKKGNKFYFQDFGMDYEKILDDLIAVTNETYYDDSFVLVEKNKIKYGNSTWIRVSEK